MNVTTETKFPVVDLPCANVLHGYKATIARMEEMKKNLEAQVKEMSRKISSMSAQYTLDLERDYEAAVLKRLGLSIGDRFLTKGKVYSLQNRNIHTNRCTGNAEHIRHTYKVDYHQAWAAIEGRPCASINTYCYIGGDCYTLANDGLWLDTYEVFFVGANCTLPPKTDAPLGSHFPLNKQVKAALTAAKVKIADPDYKLTFDYPPATAETRTGMASVPVLGITARMNPWQCANLRSVANHTNQYNKMLAYFSRKNWLESHAYTIETDAESGAVTGRVMQFIFKLLEPKAGEEIES